MLRALGKGQGLTNFIESLAVREHARTDSTTIGRSTSENGTNRFCRQLDYNSRSIVN